MGEIFQYYTAPWMAIFSLLAPFASFGPTSKRFQRLTYVVLWAPIVIAAIASTTSSRDASVQISGAERVAAYVDALDKGHDKCLYVWGYRPDVYVYAQRTSCLRFINRQFVHPDAQISSDSDRRARVFPEYFRRFQHEFSSALPDILVVYRRAPLLASVSDDFVQEQIEQKYSLVRIIHDVAGTSHQENGVFLVFVKI